VGSRGFEPLFSGSEGIGGFESFARFCVSCLGLTKRTIESHKNAYRYVSKFVVPEKADFQQLQEIVSKRKEEGKKVANLVKFIRVFYGKYLGYGWAKTFKIPKDNSFKPKIIPSRYQLQVFYNCLPNEKAKTLFLMLASSGLRVSELLLSQIDLKNRIIIPKEHEGKTKHSYISFFNEEAKQQYVRSGDWGKITRRTLEKWFDMASKKSEIKITPQMLREWFCSEMLRLGVPEVYVDAFCGRVPRTILARHYTDYSPEKLKEIYDKANLKVLS